MNAKPLTLAVPAALLLLNCEAASAGKITDEEAHIVCAIDKWDETEPEKGHKLADAAMRCVLIHDDPAVPKTTEECAGKYEYMPDGSWKAAGTCIDTYKGGDKVFVSWWEGSGSTTRCQACHNNPS